MRKLTDRIARAPLYRAPRNATVRITLRHMPRGTRKTGRSLDAKRAARQRIEAALATIPRASRVIQRRSAAVVKREGHTPTTSRAATATVITIDQAHFRLRLFKRLKFVKTYGVAVGQPAYPTPDRPVLDPEQAGQPDVDGAEQPVGRRAAGTSDARRQRRRTR